MKWIIVLMLLARTAAADVPRYALLVGNNAGDTDEAKLLYAEADAAKLRDVLIDLGGFAPDHVVLLRDTDAATVRRTLIALNDQIRSEAGAESMLLVYYSGHADATALHLGKTALDLGELGGLVRGSSAGFRLLIVDACRSGTLTRVKGGAPGPQLRVQLDQRLPSDGVVFLTATAASEDAQESDDLRGSFFTHYLISGLLGASDFDRDGQVTLDEAYRYAYEATIRASSRTLVGAQHPTFEYSLHGQGKVVLTTLAGAGRAVLRLPDGHGYLVMAGDSEGAVVAEIGPHDRVRTLSLRPGRYFVRARGDDHLLEGALALAAGASVALDERSLTRIEYARLVRKGRVLGRVDALQLGYTIRTPLVAGASPCHGGFIGWAFELPELTIAPRLGACRSSYSNAFLGETSDTIDLAVQATHAWDLRWVTVGIGIEAGGALLHERFASPGMAPNRTTTAGDLGIVANAAVDLPGGFYLAFEAAGLGYLFRHEASETMTVEVTGSLAARGTFAIGKRW